VSVQSAETGQSALNTAEDGYAQKAVPEAAISDGAEFKNGRHLAAWVGLDQLKELLID
jgi:hypothetical protein